MKRKIYLLLTMVAVPMIFIGCGKNTTAVQTESEAPIANSEAPIFDSYDEDILVQLAKDTESDIVGMSIYDKAEQGLLPFNNSDTDGDGITDALELILGTSPVSASTAGDCIPDGYKLANNLPLDAISSLTYQDIVDIPKNFTLHEMTADNAGALFYEREYTLANGSKSVKAYQVYDYKGKLTIDVSSILGKYSDCTATIVDNLTGTETPLQIKDNKVEVDGNSTAYVILFNSAAGAVGGEDNQAQSDASPKIISISGTANGLEFTDKVVKTGKWVLNVAPDAGIGDMNDWYTWTAQYSDDLDEIIVNDPNSFPYEVTVHVPMYYAASEDEGQADSNFGVAFRREIIDKETGSKSYIGHSRYSYSINPSHIRTQYGIVGVALDTLKRLQCSDVALYECNGRYFAVGKSYGEQYRIYSADISKEGYSIIHEVETQIGGYFGPDITLGDLLTSVDSFLDGVRFDFKRTDGAEKVIFPLQDNVTPIEGGEETSTDAPHLNTVIKSNEGERICYMSAFDQKKDAINLQNFSSYLSEGGCCTGIAYVTANLYAGNGIPTSATPFTATSGALKDKTYSYKLIETIPYMKKGRLSEIYSVKEAHHFFPEIEGGIDACNPENVKGKDKEIVELFTYWNAYVNDTQEKKFYLHTYDFAWSEMEALINYFKENTDSIVICRIADGLWAHAVNITGVEQDANNKDIFYLHVYDSNISWKAIEKDPSKYDLRIRVEKLEKKVWTLGGYETEEIFSFYYKPHDAHFAASSEADLPIFPYSTENISTGEQIYAYMFQKHQIIFQDMKLNYIR